ncbi:MAG: TonB-dependent receptor, partial [Bacteroidetes bacterium]|nr:TonB-dependent receptor [Bacteroidota bacterium]
MKRTIILLAFLAMVIWNTKAQSQKIKIDVVGISLNKVLVELRDNYGIQFSFDDKLLSRYSVTAKMEFDSKDDAIFYLISGLPLSVEKSGEIFVVFPSESKKRSSKKNVISRVGGQVVEAGTFEPLPFSQIIINEKQVQSDQNGNFNFLASADTSFNMQISHLGYYVYDTLFNNSLNQKFHLKPSVTELEEVKIEGYDVERATLIGDAAGNMKVNHTIAPYLPGYGDNSVYNLLRLMPGVMASGEQSSDLMVWGSYEGQSKVQFDGFTIFGLKNFNDNIGVVNPLLIKTIRVFKGAYEANYGDRVGGIIQINGINGNIAKPSLTLNINNSTINSLVEVPIGKKSTVLGAYRQTYYNLYNPYDLNVFRNMEMSSSWEWNNESHHSSNNMVDVVVVPDYKFSDANFKYSYRGDKGDIFSASLYSGGDYYSYNVEGESGIQQLSSSLSERNKQLGASLSYSKIWGKEHNSTLTISYSDLDNETNESNSTSNNMGNNMGHDWGNSNEQVNQEILQIKNKIDEFSAELVDKFSLLNGNQFDLGLGYQINNVLLDRNITDENAINLNGLSEKYYLFVQGILPLSKKLLVKPGFRTIFANEIGEFYFEPKLSVTYNITEPFKINASWGRYHQFLSKTPFVDNNLNYTWFWTASNGTTIPVLDATHWVSGISYNKNDFLLSIEGYLKNTNGVTRYSNETQQIDKGFYSGKSRSYGIDFYVKKEYKKNVAWISYTISKAEENLSNDASDKHILAPQDQRHELKLAGIYNWKA